METAGATSCDTLVLSHFSSQIFQALGYPDRRTAIIKRKWRVAATSVCYFHQFYEVNSLLEHDPRLVMLSCIFLAGKAEDNFVNIQELFKIYPKFPEAKILECEIVLLESLNFHLKVFHPQNCVYSIIADIKRQAQPQPQAQTQAQAQSQAVQGSSGVVDLTTSSSTSGVSGADGSGANNAAGVLEGTDKAKLSAITNEWLASAELHLCTLQSTGLVIKLNPLIVAICALKLAAPAKLSEVIDFDAYLLDKFGADFIKDNITANMVGVSACLRKGQDWAGDSGNRNSSNSGNNSGGTGGGESNSAEVLSACMRELKLKNKWKKQ